MFKRTPALFVVLVLSLILTTAACETLFGPSAGSTPAQLEQEIFKLVNDYRRSQGLGDLAWNGAIADAAREHSQNMAAGSVPFGHDGYNERWSRLGQVLPWQSIAEVVACSGSAKDAVNAWIASPNHQTYLVGDFALSGVGVAKPSSGGSFYATQIFIKPQ
jgi:uncharacterized protein YkwD